MDRLYRPRIRRAVAGRVASAVVVVAAGLFVAAHPPAALAADNVITVNTLAFDSTVDGACSLMEAIENVNTTPAGDVTGGDCAAGSTTDRDYVTFAGSLSGLTILTTGSHVRIMTVAGTDTAPVAIDGDLDNDGNPDITIQRSSGAGSALEIGRTGGTNTDITIVGLDISTYSAAAIELLRVTNVLIEDCVLHGNGDGIVIRNVNTNAVTIRDCIIGLTAAGAADGNADTGIQVNDGADIITIEDSVVSANVNMGIRIAGGGGGEGASTRGTGILIRNNLIGTDLTGSTCGASGGNPPWNTYGNGQNGIDFSSGVDSSTIEDNVVSCNGRRGQGTFASADGMEIGGGASTANVIQSNYVGTNAAGTNLGNSANGIDLDDGAQRNVIQFNTIAFNGFNNSGGNNNDGVHIDGSSTDRNRVTQNSIDGNDGLGIDLRNSDGVTPNDSNDTDSGANDTMNYPLITSAVWVGGSLQVNGCFDGKQPPPAAATDEAPFIIELVCNTAVDPTGYGEGRRYASSVTLTGDVGTMTFGPPTCTTPGVLATFLPPAGCYYVAATATNRYDSGGSPRNSTSEFGPNAEALTCELTPETAQNQLPGDTTHAVTAVVRRGATPLAGLTVDFTVSGVNSVGGPDPSTNGSGVATFSYTSNGLVGSDAIAATVTDAGETATCTGPNATASVAKDWILNKPVQLVRFEATRAGRSVVLSWETVSEIKHAGFRVWREAPDGGLVPVGPALVPGRGTELAGSVYGLTDFTAPADMTRYWLDDISTTGNATRHGPAVAPRFTGRAIELPPHQLPRQ